jgi:SAM-dependent methyltransferase
VGSAQGGLAVDDAAARRFLREHAHYRDDLDFWRHHARRLGDPVLDLGAAAGRVALALAADGHEVWAVDSSEAMLAEIDRVGAEHLPAAVRPRTVRADMRSLRLGRRFPLVIIAMNTFQALVEPEDQLACLRAVRAHLTESGELIFDVALPDPAELADSIGLERAGGSFTDPATGAVLNHSAWYDSWDPLTQTLEFTHRIVERDASGREQEHLRRHRVHLFMPVEMDHLLARAGLETLEAMGDFAGGPLTGSGESQIRRCRARA